MSDDVDEFIENVNVLNELIIIWMQDKFIAPGEVCKSLALIIIHIIKSYNAEKSDLEKILKFMTIMFDRDEDE